MKLSESLLKSIFNIKLYYFVLAEIHDASEAVNLICEILN